MSLISSVEVRVLEQSYLLVHLIVVRSPKLEQQVINNNKRLHFQYITRSQKRESSAFFAALCSSCVATAQETISLNILSGIWCSKRLVFSHN